jgi:hypothetical protein
MVDADTKEVQARKTEFEEECDRQQVPCRLPEEAVAIAVPKRNIETWIYYLNGGQVNETQGYPKLGKERLCKPAVNKLAERCQISGLNENAPPSLLTACEEYGTRIKPLM